jgi:hypothetical protein
LVTEVREWHTYVVDSHQARERYGVITILHYDYMFILMADLCWKYSTILIVGVLVRTARKLVLYVLL